MSHSLRQVHLPVDFLITHLTQSGAIDDIRRRDLFINRLSLAA